jgi:hypothetical protein
MANATAHGSKLLPVSSSGSWILDSMKLIFKIEELYGILQINLTESSRITDKTFSGKVKA